MSKPSQTATEFIAELKRKREANPQALKSLTYDKIEVSMFNNVRRFFHKVAVTLVEIPASDYALLYQANWYGAFIYFMQTGIRNDYGYYSSSHDINFGNFWCKLKDTPEVKTNLIKGTEFEAMTINYSSFIAKYYATCVKQEEGMQLNHQSLPLRWIKEGKLIITPNV